MDFLHFFIFTNFIINATANLSSIIKFQVRNTGYHRELYYEINFNNFSNSTSYNVEDFMLLQTIPASAYVSTDQLNNLMRTNQIETYVPVHTDVELPAIKAFAFQFYIFGGITNKYTVSIPVHFRYQSPTDMKFVRVEMQGPVIYTKCQPGEELQSKVQACEEHPCRSGTLGQVWEISETIPICWWRKIELTNGRTVISILIPAAYVHSYKLVLPITLIIGWLGSLYLCYIIFKKSSDIKIKRK